MEVSRHFNIESGSHEAVRQCAFTKVPFVEALHGKSKNPLDLGAVHLVVPLHVIAPASLLRLHACKQRRSGIQLNAAEIEWEFGGFANERNIGFDTFDRGV